MIQRSPSLAVLSLRSAYDLTLKAIQGRRDLSKPTLKAEEPTPTERLSLAPRRR